jgi:two-component system CheB/CheR fusion protein
MNDELQFTNDALRDHQDEVDRVNKFMTSVLSSMNSGVAVVGTDLQILAWNARAEDLWGIRTDEAVGAHLFNLDIGLPLEALRQPLKQLLGGADGEPVQVDLDAINRRGRALKVRVTLSGLRENGEEPAAMLMMDVTETLSAG